MMHRSALRSAVLDRVPDLWPVPMAACALLFGGHWLFGANTSATGGAVAAAWLILGGASVVMAGGLRAPPPLLIAAALCFAGVTAVAVGQLLPFPPFASGAHPLWDLVPSAGPAATLDRDATLRELLKLLALAAAATVGYVVGDSDRRARFFFFLLVLASVAYAGWAFLHHFSDPGSLAGLPKAYHAGRLTASFLSANSAATALGMLAVIAAARIARAVKEADLRPGAGAGAVERLARKGGMAALALFVLLTCVLATLSRAGLAAAAAAIILLVAWEIRATMAKQTAVVRGLAMGVALAAAAGVVVAVLVSGDLASRLGAGAKMAGDRAVVFGAHLQAILAAPWRGYGLGAFAPLNDLLQTADNHRDLERLYALHNVYLQWVEEAGLPGAALMFACVGCVLAHIWSGLSHRQYMRTWLRAGLLVSFVPLAHGLVDYGLQVPSIALQWALILGIASGLAAPRASETAAQG